MITDPRLKLQVDQLLQQAQALKASGNHAGAAAIAQRILQINPNDPVAPLYLQRTNPVMDGVQAAAGWYAMRQVRRMLGSLWIGGIAFALLGFHEARTRGWSAPMFPRSVHPVPLSAGWVTVLGALLAIALTPPLFKMFSMRRGRLF